MIYKRQRFAEHLHLIFLMMDMESVSETLEIIYHLTQLPAQENFIEFFRHANFKMYDKLIFLIEKNFLLAELRFYGDDKW
jgi:hypothetical protein